MSKSYADLTIDELIDDPMTQAIMRADRVDRSELEAMLRALAPLVARAAGRGAAPFFDHAVPARDKCGNPGQTDAGKNFPHACRNPMGTNDTAPAEHRLGRS